MFNRFCSRTLTAGLLALLGMTLGCGGSPSQPTPPVPPVPPASPLSVTSISPTTGSTGGAASLKIVGTGFTPSVTVTFDGSRVTGSFDSRDQGFTTILLETPAHQAGAVDVVVTNADGQFYRLSGGYTYVSPDSFDINGSWSGTSYDGSDRGMQFTIENNRLVSAACISVSSETFPFALPSPPRASNGEFSFKESDGVSISGRIVSADEVVGTMNIGPCTNMAWRGYRR